MYIKDRHFNEFYIQNNIASLTTLTSSLHEENSRQQSIILKFTDHDFKIKFCPFLFYWLVEVQKKRIAIFNHAQINNCFWNSINEYSRLFSVFIEDNHERSDLDLDIVKNSILSSDKKYNYLYEVRLDCTRMWAKQDSPYSIDFFIIDNIENLSLENNSYLKAIFNPNIKT